MNISAAVFEANRLKLLQAGVEIHSPPPILPLLLSSQIEHIPFLSCPQAPLSKTLEREIQEFRQYIRIQLPANFYDTGWHTIEDLDFKKALRFIYRQANDSHHTRTPFFRWCEFIEKNWIPEFKPMAVTIGGQVGWYCYFADIQSHL